MTTPCPCGQTYGTCRRHPGTAPEVCTITFEFNGQEMHTSILRPTNTGPETWEAIKDYALENVAEKLDNGTAPDVAGPVEGVAKRERSAA